MNNNKNIFIKDYTFIYLFTFIDLSFVLWNALDLTSVGFCKFLCYEKTP